MGASVIRVSLFQNLLEDYGPTMGRFFVIISESGTDDFSVLHLKGNGYFVRSPLGVESGLTDGNQLPRLLLDIMSEEFPVF